LPVAPAERAEDHRALAGPERVRRSWRTKALRPTLLASDAVQQLRVAESG
jgi:hypothetical protein